MDNKIPVQIKPTIKTKYVYEKLRICNNCHRYTILREDNCTFCGKPGLLPLREKAAATVRRTMRNERLAAILITLISIFFGRSFQEMAIGLAGGVILTGCLWFVQRRLLPRAVSREIARMFLHDRQRIADGLIANLDRAVETGKEDKARSYEMLREIAALVHDDTIRSLQIILLQSFVLRKDMELELEPLLQSRFDPDLARYIGELAKIKRELIKDRTFRYILKYEHEIASLERGEDILAGVAGAAVRLKRYVLSYSDFISRYARLLPKERFLRLYRVIATNPNEPWTSLADEVYRIYNEKYQWDADFQQITPRSISL
ncbi:hypothetical protein NYE70_25010 [Paenibacillus sp. FSL R5-0407]|uniref:hypothetical protein n=2 Tax=unclassified Paenibacillus TaxID=185978 RepID=UPI0030FC9C82